MEKLLQLELGLCEEDLHIDAILSSHYAFEQNQVWVIHPSGRPTLARNVMELFDLEHCTLKVEGYEKLSLKIHEALHRVARDLGHTGLVTCHLFRSPEGAASFPRHTDPDDVLIHVVTGRKTIVTDQCTYLLEAGDTLFIPRNTYHRAVNQHESLMLSIGLESFTVEKL